MRRRDFITFLGGAAAWPLATRAQQRPLPVIGWLDPRSPDTNLDSQRAFLRGLMETGYSEGENVTIVHRWAENQLDRLPVMAAELARRRVAVIVTSGGRLAHYAAKAATKDIPIVFHTAEDPVRAGLVTSFARPSGNLTGVTFLTLELLAKRLALLHEMVPGASRIAAISRGCTTLILRWLPSGSDSCVNWYHPPSASPCSPIPPTWRRDRPRSGRWNRPLAPSGYKSQYTTRAPVRR